MDIPPLPSDTLIQHLLEKANRKYHFIFLLLLDAGGRPLEIARLKNEDLDFQARRITFNARSESRVRKIPLTDRLFESALDYWANRSTKSDYLFPPS